MGGNNEISSFKFNLFKNNGDLTFTESAAEADLALTADEKGPGKGDPLRTGAYFADYDSDGDEDIFAVAAGLHPTSVAESFRYLYNQELYSNNGDGAFTSVPVADILVTTWYAQGAAFSDIDNDSRPDIFMPGLVGNVFLNKGEASFTAKTPFDFTVPNGVYLSSGDLNGDGFVDIVVPTIKQFEKGGPPVLLRNIGNGNSWVTVKTVGTKSNRGGVGAVVTVKSGDTAQARTVRAGEGYGQSGMPWPMFGLGSTEKVDIEVRWPSGLVEVFEGQAGRRTVEVVEGTGKAL